MTTILSYVNAWGSKKHMDSSIISMKYVYVYNIEILRKFGRVHNA